MWGRRKRREFTQEDIASLGKHLISARRVDEKKLRKHDTFVRIVQWIGLSETQTNLFIKDILEVTHHKNATIIHELILRFKRRYPPKISSSRLIYNPKTYQAPRKY